MGIRFKDYSKRYEELRATDGPKSVALVPFLLAASIGELFENGWTVGDVIGEMGIRGGRLRSKVGRDSGRLLTMTHKLAPRAGEAMFAVAFQVVVQGGLNDLATAKCIHRHLPRDRQPTRDDVRKAIKECQKKRYL